MMNKKFIFNPSSTKSVINGRNVEFSNPFFKEFLRNYKGLFNETQMNALTHLARMDKENDIFLI